MPRFDGLVQGKRWASDWPIPGVQDLSAEIARLRFQLTPPEIERYRRVDSIAGKPSNAPPTSCVQG